MRRLLRRLGAMCEPAHRLLSWSLRLSCVIMCCALVICVRVSAGDMELRASVDALSFAEELYRLPQSVLLVAVIASAIVEDKCT